MKFTPGVILPEDTSPNPRSEKYFARLMMNRDVEPDNYSSDQLGKNKIKQLCEQVEGQF